MEAKNFDKNKIFNAAVIALALIIAVKIYGVKTQGINLLSEKKASEQKRTQLLKNISQWEKKIGAYGGIFNQQKKDAPFLINTIGKLAGEAQVKITLIKPGEKEKFPLYARYPLNLVVESDSYHALGNFISKLENHPDVYFLDTLELQKGSPDNILETNKREVLRGTLNLSIIFFND